MAQNYEQHSHTEYSQRCNLHLSYLGKGIYVQHEIRTVTVAYDIFGLPEPLNLDVQMESITIGTCTADKQETLDKLFHLGITSSPTAETGKILSEDIPPPYDLPSSESETANSYDPAIKLDKLKSTPQPSTSSAAASTYRQPTTKVKPLKSKLPEELDILDDYPPLDILLHSENDPDFESDKNDDLETSPDEPVTEEPKYMKLYRTYIKSDLHVSLTRLSKDEI